MYGSSDIEHRPDRPSPYRARVRWFDPVSKRHTGLTWFADAGVPAHVLRKIAGHGSLLTTQRYFHPDMTQITNAGNALTAPITLAVQPAPGHHRWTDWSPPGTQQARKGGTGFLRYRLRPAKTLVGTTGFEPATP
ncbi:MULTISPECIES: site-specific integrase [unclassified Streptomyces]|uniref:site-specific integrase n=1 Tax=unclassified Streptomyces TaxID=2593676 RepID=UPI00081E9BB2|nr:MULTISPECIES: site-specific integrase [unclassified Streptomyces]SCG04902.1 Phage integrase family protein [Streptomyces sp. MnatMP-M17]